MLARLGAAEALRRDNEAEPSSPELRIYERYVREARAGAEEEFHAAREEGRGMTDSEAVHYALTEWFERDEEPEIGTTRP